MRNSEEVWEILFDKLEHGREREHIFRYAGVTGANMQAWAKDKVGLLQIISYDSCASLKELDVALRLNCRSIHRYALDMVYKRESMSTMLEFLLAMNLWKNIFRSIKARKFILSKNETRMRSFAFHRPTTASYCSWKKWRLSTSCASPRFSRKRLEG